MTFFNVADAWLQRLRSSLGVALDSGTDISVLNVGDSIATGIIGIDHPAEHYVAVAAELVARRTGREARRRVHTAGPLHDGGTVEASGAVLLQSAGFFGSVGWMIGTGASGRLQCSLPAGGGIVRVGYSGDGGRFSVDGGVSWQEPPEQSAAGGCRVTELRLPPGGALVVAADGTWPLLVHFVQIQADPAVSWYTGGIGAKRTGDLRVWLEADGGLGFDAYAAARPHLLVVEIGVNDTIHADEQSIAGTLGALRAAVGGLVERDVPVALIGAMPVQPEFQPGPWRVEDAYREIYRPVALEFAVPLLEVPRLWGDHAAASGAGLVADQVHPSAAGHRELGEVLADLVSAAL